MCLSFLGLDNCSRLMESTWTYQLTMFSCEINAVNIRKPYGGFFFFSGYPQLIQFLDHMLYIESHGDLGNLGIPHQFHPFFLKPKIHQQPVAHSQAIHPGWEWTPPAAWPNGHFVRWASSPWPPWASASLVGLHGTQKCPKKRCLGRWKKLEKSSKFGGFPKSPG